MNAETITLIRKECEKIEKERLRREAEE